MGFAQIQRHTDSVAKQQPVIKLGFGQALFGGPADPMGVPDKVALGLSFAVEQQPAQTVLGGGVSLPGSFVRKFDDAFRIGVAAIAEIENMAEIELGLGIAFFGKGTNSSIAVAKRPSF